MAVHPIEAFRNPVSRPRAIIWTGTVLVALLVFIAVAVAASSSFWFCAEVCHKVQDDAVNAYLQGPHNQVSCLDCHLPSNANPVLFLYHKVESAVGELPMTFANTFEVPINKESKVSLSSIEFPDTQCTQCHDVESRQINTTDGLIFDHKTHSDLKIRCTFCHNRTAHPEKDLTLVLVQPKTGEKAVPHPDYMSMDACFRCHSLDNGAVASGKCSFCHSDTSNLVPASHSASDYLYSHGRLFIAEEKKVEDAEKETGQKAPTPASVRQDLNNLAAGKSTGGAGSDDFQWPVAPIDTVNSCYTCHTKSFCENCHEQKGVHFQL